MSIRRLSEFEIETKKQTFNVCFEMDYGWMAEASDVQNYMKFQLKSGKESKKWKPNYIPQISMPNGVEIIKRDHLATYTLNKRVYSRL